MHSTWHLQAAQLDNMEGVMSSQHKPGQSGTHNPGVEGALEVNPDIYRGRLRIAFGVSPVCLLGFVS